MANPLKAGRTASKVRKPSTPAQRAFGGGRQIGKRIGRKQGAAAGLAAGVTVSEIRNMTSESKLTKMLKEENLSLAQKNAIQETLLKLAGEQIKNTRTVPRNSQSPKPKLRQAKGGAVKLKGGGTPAVASPTAKRIIPSSEPPWLTQMKKEADKLGIPLRELLTMHNNKGPKKPKAKGKKASMKAAKGGYSKKK